MGSADIKTKLRKAVGGLRLSPCSLRGGAGFSQVVIGQSGSIVEAACRKLEKGDGGDTSTRCREQELR